MVYATGIAQIKHAETGDVYEIDSDMIDFEVTGSEERGMGPEVTYSAILHHPELGKLVWSIWEYPVGVENYRETNVGPHELIENIDFELEFNPPDDSEGNEDEARRARIDALIEWFHERYEDPANRLPYESAEGGYQWIWGGPYDAREVIEENFPNESEGIIDAAVDEIESDGLMEWAPVSSPDDYDQDIDDENESSDGNLRAILRELDVRIAGIPEPQTYPVFRVGNDSRLHIAMPPDRWGVVADNALLEELRTVTGDLGQSLAGTNAHTDLQYAATRYEAALSEDPLSISLLYACGVRLDNATHTTRQRIEAEELPPLSSGTEQHLNSVLDLHAAYVMSRDDGRNLAQGADAYRRSPDQMEALKNTAERIAAAIERTPALFAKEVREHISSVTQDIGQGAQPRRSNQVAATSIGNLAAGLLKAIGSGGGAAAVVAIVGGAVTMSAPGADAVAGGAAAINAAWSFLTANAHLLSNFVAVVGADLSWLTPILQLLDRLNWHQKK